MDCASAFRNIRDWAPALPSGAVITPGDDISTRGCIEANAHTLARYAALCQEASIVPIVESEVLMDGAHTLARCREVTKETLLCVFGQHSAQGVGLTDIGFGTMKHAVD
jgi:fructose-bisphosphate aldolase class 1